MLSKKLRPFLVLPILLVLLFLSLFLFANHLIQKPSFQDSLIKALASDSGFDIRTTKIEVNLWGGVGLLVHGLEARSRKGTESLVASKVRIILSKGDLVRGHIVPLRLSLIDPRIEAPWGYGRTGEGSGAVQWARAFPLIWIPSLKTVNVKNGHIIVQNRPIQFTGLQFSVSQIKSAPLTFVANCKGRMGFKGEKIPFAMRGTITQDRVGQYVPSLDVEVQAKDIPVNMLPWPSYLAGENGYVETSLKLEGKLDGPISIGGRISSAGPRFSLSQGKRKMAYSPASLAIDFKSVLKGKKLGVPSIQIKTPDMFLNAALEVDLADENNPWMDLKVNSPFVSVENFKHFVPLPVLPAWVEKKLFPMVETGNVRLANLSLRGRFNDIQELALPKNQSLLSLRIECNGLKIFQKGMPGPVRDISAVIVLEKGKVAVSGLGGRSERSAVRAASLDVNNVFGRTPTYAVSLVGSFDLQDLARHMDTDLFPDRVRKHLPLLKPVSGNMECLARLDYEEGWDFPRVVSGEFVFKDLTVEMSRWFLPLAFSEAQVVIDSDNQNRFGGTGKWGNSAFQMSGEFGMGENAIAFRRGNISGAMDMNEMLAFFMNVDDHPFSFNKPVQWTVSISKKENDLSLSGLIDLQGVAMETDEITINPPGDTKHISFELGIGPDRAVDLKRLTMALEGSSLEVKGSYNIRGRDVVALSLSIPSLSMKDLGVRFKKRMRRLKGVLEGSVEVRTTLKKDAERTIDGRIKGKDFFLVWPRIASPVEECDFTLDFSGKNLHIISSSMKIGKTPLQITGDLDINDGMKGEVTLESDFLNMDDLWPRSETPLPGVKATGGSAEKTKTMELSVHLKALQGQWRSLTLGPSQMDLNITDRDIHVRDSKILLEHGLLRFKGYLKRGDDPGFRMSSHIQFSEQPVEELLESVGIGKGPLTGSLTMEAYLFSQGDRREELFPHLNGTFNVMIKKGVLRSPDVLVKVFDFLSYEKIFAKRPPDISKEGFYFESMGGHAVIQDGLVETDNLMMKSSSLNAVASGTVNMAKETIDIHLGTQPLETVDVVVSKIPILGYILTGEKKALLTYYFTVKGPLGDAEVKHVPFRSLGGGMAGLFKRLFLTPVKLFKDISGAAKRLPEPMTPLSEETTIRDTDA
ncbi:AsmA-like C-terminal domain-containing protein [Thermodesulfobacteriota bacterium]